MEYEKTNPTIKTGLFLVLLLLYVVVFNPRIRTGQMMWFALVGFVGLCLLYVLLAKGTLRGNYMTKWIFVSYAFFCCSLLWAEVKTFPNSLKSLILIFGICLLLLYTLESFRDIEKLMRILQLATLIAGLYVVLMMDRSQLGEVRLGRALEDTMNSNDISMKMCLGLPLSFYFLGKSKSLSAKIFNFSAIVLFVFVIFYSGSRNGLLTMLATCVCYLLIRSKGVKRFWAILGSVFLLIGVYILIMNYEPLYNVLGSRIEEMINGFMGNSNDSSFDWRTLMMREGWRYFTESPIIGRGIDNFRYLFGAQYGFETYAHNNYIEILVSGGLAGFLLYYSIYFHVLKGLWKYAVVENEPMAICVFVINLSMLISHFSGVLYYSWEVNTFLVLGALYISIKKGTMKNEAEIRKIEEKMEKNEK